MGGASPAPGGAGAARVQAALHALDARRGPEAPSLAAADHAARRARDAFFDACLPASGHDAGAAALALQEAERAPSRILDALSEEDWGILVAAGYRVLHERDWE